MFHKSKRAFALVAYSSISAVLASPSNRNYVARAAQASTNLCGDYDYIILDNSPWIVYNMLYNAAEIVGSQCTYYDSMTASSSGTSEVIWSSETDITYVESTNNIPKGYSFVGLTQNLETRLSDIGSIPADYSWTRTNSTTFKGNVCFDFMTNDVKGDSTSSDSHELMLWLEYEGGQLPIGWVGGSVATIDDLFGTSWNLYEGVNDDTGITVSSLLPTTQFDGTFTGDLKDWLLALSKLGKFADTTYVNVGNAGTEFFYGNAVLNATLALQIDLGSDSTTSAAATTSSSPATSVAASAPSSSLIVSSSKTSVGPASTQTPASSIVLVSSPLVTSSPTSAQSSSASLSTSASLESSSASIVSSHEVPIPSTVKVPSVASSILPESTSLATSSSIAPSSASSVSSSSLAISSTTLLTTRHPHRPTGFSSKTVDAPEPTATAADDDTCEI